MKTALWRPIVRRWFINTHGAKGRLSFAVVAFAAFVGCRGPGTDVILTTRLPVKAPSGQNEGIMYSMCTDMGKQKERPQDALKVGFVTDKGELVSERVVHCEKVRKAFR